MSLADRFREHGMQLARQHLRPDAVLAPESRAVVREVRDPSAALQPVTTKWLAPGAPMVPEFDARAAIRAYYSDVIVNRCIDLIADKVAQLPFVAGPRPPARPGATAEINPNARLSQMLGQNGQAAPQVTADELWAWTTRQRLITGMHGWEVEVSKPTDEVVALWPLVSSEIKVIPSRGGATWWAGFEYGEDPKTRKPRRLTVEQVIFGLKSAAHDYRQPESALQAARLDVAVAVMLGRYNHAFLRNDARPAAVVVTEPFSSDEDFWRFKSQWNSNFGGVDNAGKIAFLETPDDEDSATRIKPSEALNVQILGLSQKDARFIETEKAAHERIAMAFGVPWSMLDASGRTFDNASQEAQNFWHNTMLPILSALANIVNTQLSPRLGGDIGWFDLSGVPAFQDEKKVTAVGAPSLYQSGIANLNEAREAVGLSVIDDGDRFITLDEIAALKGGQLALPPARSTSYPATISTSTLQRQEGPERDRAAASGADATGSAPVVESDAEPSTAVRDVRRIVARLAEFDAQRSMRALTAEEQEQRRSLIWRTNDATVRTLEKRWRSAMERLFKRQADRTIKRLTGNRGRRVVEQRTSADDIFDRAYWLAEMLDEAEGLYEAVTSAGFARIAQIFGIDFDLEAPYARRFIEARANQLAGQVTDTTYEAIKDALSAGVGEGEAIPELAERVRQVFDVATGSRSETIARTEVNSAYGGSSRLAGDQLPDDVLGGYEWISTVDQRTRDDHANADGQVIQRDGSFDLGGEPCQYPGDPSLSPENSINCRCAVAALTPEEMSGRSRVSLEVAHRLLGGVRVGDHVSEAGLRIDELAMRRARHERVTPTVVATEVEPQTPPWNIIVNVPVTIPAQAAPEVHVTQPAPEIIVNAPDVHVAAPIVNVAPAEVTVNNPPERSKTYERDERGLILRVVPDEEAG